ncbi:hypothetical protein M432DRAFT_191650 [Thermoascus aurantiacus ATCC 26904]
MARRRKEVRRTGKIYAGQGLSVHTYIRELSLLDGRNSSFSFHLLLLVVTDPGVIVIVALVLSPPAFSPLLPSVLYHPFPFPLIVILLLRVSSGPCPFPVCVTIMPEFLSIPGMLWSSRCVPMESSRVDGPRTVPPRAATSPRLVAALPVSPWTGPGWLWESGLTPNLNPADAFPATRFPTSPPPSTEYRPVRREYSVPARPFFLRPRPVLVILKIIPFILDTCRPAFWIVATLGYLGPFCRSSVQGSCCAPSPHTSYRV